MTRNLGRLTIQHWEQEQPERDRREAMDRFCNELQSIQSRVLREAFAGPSKRRRTFLGWLCGDAA
jgi:hypothetical protein